MYPDNAMQSAKSFLEKYTRGQHFFTPHDEYDPKDPDLIRLYFSSTEFSFDCEEAPTAVFFFTAGPYYYTHDEELQKNIQSCMDALKSSHPEIFENLVKAIVRDKTKTIISMGRYV